MLDPTTRKLALYNLTVAFAAFGLASFLGFYQVLERSGLIHALNSPAGYFASVSTHGVLMGFVLTTFFIVGFGYYTAAYSLGRPVWKPDWAWGGCAVSLLGTVFAAIPLLAGKASVLYTFYPPIQAPALFYLGATLLVAGSWVWCVIMIRMALDWQKDNPGGSLPLPMFATAANAMLWLWTSAGVALEMVFQLLPWSLGLMDTIDVGLARTLFAWTLHPIVYFWLIPAYIALYCYVPKAAGGFLFSDELARLAFLMLMVFGLPIGFHHLYMDPEQNAGWKMVHGIGTFAVAIPTLITGFTVIASLELAARARGGAGLFGWILHLPWREPMVLAAVLSLLMLVLGGFGGLVNASYAMNAVVHNTAWVPGHFHLIFAGTVVTMYFALGYQLWPKLTGRALHSKTIALTQLWSWFIGMAVLTTPWHVLGLLGQPRRISSVTYNSLLTLAWTPYELLMILGGAILLMSAVLFIYNLVRTSQGSTEATDAGSDYAETRRPVQALPAFLQDFKLWNYVILGLMVVSFAYPVLQFLWLGHNASTAWSY